MLNRDHNLVGRCEVEVEGVLLNKADLLYLLGFVNGAMAVRAQIAQPPPPADEEAKPVDCPLTDEEYQLIEEDDDEDDDDEGPEFPTAYEGPRRGPS